MPRLAFTLWSVCFACLACGGPAHAPEDTLDAFLEAMDDSATDSASLERAYRLLDADARTALEARARKAQTLSGRPHAPWEMLAQGRFRLRFAPAAHGGMRAEVTGDRAVVQVRGERPGQSARVPMVREGGKWRVALAIPPLSGPETRPSTHPAAAAPGG